MSRTGVGPFLWLNPKAPLLGFREVPPGGMCLSVFLFVRRDSKMLLGKYADHPAWEQLAGLDQARRVSNGSGWTIPGRQLRFGEDPRNAARQIGDEILGLSGLRFGQPRVETDVYERNMSPGTHHFDVWFFVDADASGVATIDVPAWYSALAWHDPTTLSRAAYARQHEDVVARWLAIGSAEGEWEIKD